MLLERLGLRKPAKPTNPSDVERAALQERYVAWRDLPSVAGRTDWPPAAPAALGATTVPDIQASELTYEAMAEGLLRYGAIIVRGLLDPAQADGLREGIDRVEDMIVRSRAGDEVDFSDAGQVAWRAPLAAPDTGEVVGGDGRIVNEMFAGSFCAADSPHLALELLDFYRQSGVTGMIEEFLGEPPAVSLEKWVLRKVPPTTNTSWHQDGAFIGTDVRAVNLWIALNDCGVDASGLDMVPRRFDEIVATGTPGAHFDWDVSPDVVEDVRGDAEVLAPAFAPGDAVIFDQFLLHRTGVKPGMTRDRYAVEAWFFAPSHFPSDYNGLMA